MASDQVYNEEQIEEEFGEDYDQPKPADDDFPAPYRTLTQWYVTSSADPESRAALPEKSPFKKKQLLCGRLQGKNAKIPPIHVEIPVDGYVISVDFTSEKRGLWVETAKAWYWLHDCHESQEEVHQITRAKFGLMSNLIDTLLEGEYFETSHCNLSPKVVHQKLSCMDHSAFDTFKQNRDGDTSLIFDEPFDYELMSEQGGVTLVKHHLGGFLEGLAASKFWKELKKITGRKTGTAKWTPDEYRASAEQAEARSQRTPWGQLLPNPKPIRPNWNMEARLDQEQYVKSPKAKRPQRRGAGEGEPARKKQKKQRIVPGEDNHDYMIQQEMAMAANDIKQASYSEERMVKALDDLKDLLTPLPKNQSGKWEDVSERKFMVKDVDSAKAFIRGMREPSVTRSIEWKLLVVTAFMNVCLKETKDKKDRMIVSSLCKGKEGGAASGLGIFEQWKREALNTLNRLAKLKTDNNEWFKDIADRRLLVTYIEFIKKCFVIDTAGKLDTMKEKYDIDWNQPDFLKDVIEFEKSHAHSSGDLRRVCLLTQKHLQRIIDDEVKEKASIAKSSALAPVPAPSPAASDTKPIPNQATFVSTDASVDRDTDVQRKVSATKEEAEKKQKLASQERRKRILEKVKKPAVGSTTSRQSSQSLARPTSQEVSRDQTKPARAEATTSSASVPRESSTALDLSKRPPKKIIPEFVPVTGKEFFFKDSVALALTNSDDAKPATNGAGNDRKAHDTETRNSQPVSRHEERRDQKSRDYERPPPGPRDYARRENQRDDRYEARWRGDGRTNGSYSQLAGESPRGKRNSRDRSPHRGRPDYRHDRRNDEHPMHNDHRQSHDRYDSRSRSPGRFDRHSRSPDRNKRRSRSPGQCERRSRSPGRHDRRSRSPGRYDRRSRSPDRASRNNGSGSGPGAPGHSYVLSADYERNSHNHGEFEERRERQRASHPSEDSRNVARRVVNEVVDAQNAPSRGRGRGRPVPSWMEKDQANMPLGGAPTVAQPQSAIQSSMVQQPSTMMQSSMVQSPGTMQPSTVMQPSLSSVGDTSSRGRGRGRTLPAWMEQQQANMPLVGSSPVPTVQSTAVPSSQPAPSAQPSPLAVAEAAAAALEFMTSSQPSAAVQPQPVPVASMSSGRGRGRTMPAWMERAHQANSSGSAPPAAATQRPQAASQSANGRGRGMGRGRHATKPAWQKHGSL